MTNTKPTTRLILVIILFFLCPFLGISGDFYWVNGAGNWNDASHWSASSGGPSVGTTPGASDNAIFDNNSLLGEFSLVSLSENTAINSIYINTTYYSIIQGSSVDLTIKGNLLIHSNFGFSLGGKIIFDNPTLETKRIETHDIDFYSDLEFKNGHWEIDGHLKTAENKSIYYTSGKFKSNGNTVHTKEIIANQGPYQLDFTGSHISAIEKFDVTSATNIGGDAVYLVLSDLTDEDDLTGFTREGDDTRDATVFCVGSSLELELLITSDYNGQHISCFDYCDGEITITALGTPGPFSYRYGPAPNPFVATNIFDGLCNGSQSFTVQDSSDVIFPGVYYKCTISDNLVEPPVIIFDPPATINATCPDVCDGQAFTFPTGGTPPLNVFWPLSDETGVNPTMLCIGDNALQITDANDCFIEGIVEIFAPPDFYAGPLITHPTCKGDCDAIIELNPSGGNGGPYTFDWTPDPESGAGTNPGDGFCAGVISVTITDVDDCPYDTTITVIDPPLLTVSVDDVVDASCYETCDGKATANPEGGVPGYTYEWFDSGTGLTTGITDKTATGLCAGEYFVVVTDDDGTGCEVTSASVLIEEPDPFVIDVSVSPASCNGICDGAAAIDISGGTPPYVYSWTTVPGGVGIGAVNSISGLCSGEYQIVVTDDNGCVSAATIVEVIEPTDIVIDVAVTEPSCYDLCDGSAIATASGGTPAYTYTWLPAPGTGDGTLTPSDMCADTYTFTVTDAKDCFKEQDVILNRPAEYDITPDVTELDCFGDTDASIDITVNSGGSGADYTFTWSPSPPMGDGTANVSGLAAGTWSVTISDSELCDTVLTFLITSPDELVVDGSVISDVLCNGDCIGSAEIEITGGTPAYSILWDDPLAQTTLVAGNLCAGAYLITVTDDNGCIGTETIDVDEPDAFVITKSQTDLDCFGDCDATAAVTVISGGTPIYSILWDDPLAQTTFTAISLCAGVYNATLTDANNCDTAITITISEPAELIVTVAGINGTCFGDCTGSASVTIAGGTGPFSYEWFNAATDLPLGVDNNSISDLCKGDYYAVVTDANGCTEQSVNITIIELPEIDITLVTSTDATCAACDGTAEIDVTGGAGGFIIDWTPNPLTGDGTTSVTGLCAGAYTVNIEDAAGCTESIIISVDDIVLEVLDLDSVNVTCFGLCDGEASATFPDLDGPYILEWFNNVTGISTGIFGTPATSLCAGEYLAVLTNNSGCTTSEAITILQPDKIFGTITKTDVSCDGSCDGTASIAVTGGVGPYTYDWGIPLPGSGEGTADASGLCPGPWQVDVTDDSGCNVNFTTTILEPSPVDIIAESSTDVSCFGVDDGTASVIATGGNPPYMYAWFDCATGSLIGQTGPLATGLAPGSYGCVITDDEGCDVTSTCVSVDDALEITAVLNSNNISCFGECDGLIWATPSGGSGTYFYQWLDDLGNPLIGQTNDSLENVCSAFYNIRITDLKGCVSFFGPIDMTAPSSPWVVITSKTDITCASDCDGTATVVVLDGNNPPYTYLWDDPLTQITPTANFLCKGARTVTISDAGECDTTITFNIVHNDPIIANMTGISHVDCFGECTGTITVDPVGGTAPYTMLWSDGQVGENAIALCSGPITLTITDASGCVIDTTFNITESPEITNISSFSNNTMCGECNGSATVNVSGGTPGYAYDWTPDPSGGEGTPNAIGLCPGVVFVTITDSKGCIIIESFGVSDVFEEDITIVSTDETCFGACDGTAEAIFACSDPDCTQEWFDAGTGLSTGVTTTEITDLCEGDFFVKVTNGSDCITVEAVTINSQPEIFANEIITPITCNGSDDATITLLPSGGSGGGYAYSWLPVPPNGDGTDEALDLGPGIWKVTITDGSGCSQVFEFEIIEPAPITIDVDPTNVTCNGYCNATILAGASDGAGGFTFQWQKDGIVLPGETSPLLAGICPGNYNIIVTDGNGCTATLPKDVTISEPIEMTSAISKIDISCFGVCDGKATVTISGSSPPYIVNWYDAITDDLIGTEEETAADLCPGSYYAVITDNNGCSLTSATVDIIEPSKLTFTITKTDASCYGFCDGMADIVVLGGTPAYDYEWLTIFGDPIVGGTMPSVINLCEGNYTIEATDANGCSTDVQPVVIGSFDEIEGEVFTNDATCTVADGNASVFITGGNAPYEYQWFGAAMTPLVGETNLTLLDVFSGIYFLTVTDANGCTETFMATISDKDGPEVVFDAINNPTCAGECDGSFEITASGISPPFLYVWNPGGIIAEDATGLCAGDYILQVIDDLGCKRFVDAALIDPPQILAIADVIGTECELCNGAINLTVTGGTGALTAVWNTGETELSIDDLCSGVYEVKITDENGCSFTETFTINNSEGLTADIVVTAITCAESCDGKVTVNPSGGTAPYTFEWLHDGSTSNILTGLCAGNYYVEITDATGCATTIPVEMLDPNPIEAVPTMVNPNCGATDGSISVISSGGILPHTYLWNTGDPSSSIDGLGAGIYILTITNDNGCAMDFTYGLNNLTGPAIELVAKDEACFASCDGSIDTLSLIGGTPDFTFEWFNSDGTSTGILTPLIEDLCSGKYLLKVTDDAGCITYKSSTIESPHKIILNPLFSIDPPCQGECDGEITANPIGGTYPFVFEWDDPENQSSASAIDLCQGTYTVTIVDASGCTLTQTRTITEPDPITIVVNNIIPATCQDAPIGEIYITISGGTGIYEVQWVSETLADTFHVEDPTGLLPMYYYLEITDENGCIYFDTLAVDTLISIIADAGLDTVICFMSDHLIIGSSNIVDDQIYTWYDPFGNVLSDLSSLLIEDNLSGDAYYILTVEYEGCIDSDTVLVHTASEIIVDAGPDIEIYSTQTKVIGGSPTTGEDNVIQWTPIIIYLDDPFLVNPTVIEPESSTWYYVIATDTNGCTNLDSVYVEVIQDFDIPDGISPGSDGKNDTWILDFINQYPGVSIKINLYNRWGDLLFESDETYNDDWGGLTLDGKKLPAGTYYFVIDIDHEDFPDPITGPLTIMW